MLAIVESLDYAILFGMSTIMVVVSVANYHSKADRIRLRRLEQKVTAIIQHLGIRISEPLPGEDLSAEVRELADAGRKIPAIKRHRELTGCGLKEAKEAVEAYLDR